MSKDLALDDTKHGDEFRTGYSTGPCRVVYVKIGLPTPKFTRNDLVVFVPTAVIEGQANTAGDRQPRLAFRDDGEHDDDDPDQEGP